MGMIMVMVMLVTIAMMLVINVMMIMTVMKKRCHTVEMFQYMSHITCACSHYMLQCLN